MSTVREDRDTGRLFKFLLIGAVVTVLGQLLDLQWHATHEEFETGGDQLQAHWLVWIGSLGLLAVAYVGSGATSGTEKTGYRIALGASIVYAVLAVIHFLQHLDHQEVDWTHVSLGLAKLATVIGVAWVIVARRSANERGS